MTNLTSNEIDEVMTSIGMKVANETLGKPIDDDDVDDILVAALQKATEPQLREAVDNMIDLLSISEILNIALSSDNKLDSDELDELMEYVAELDHDTKMLMKSLTTH